MRGWINPLVFRLARRPANPRPAAALRYQGRSRRPRPRPAPAVTQHDSDRLADIAHALDRNHWLQEPFRAGQRQKTQRDARHGPDVFRGDDRADPCYGKRRAGINGGDEAVSSGAAQDGRVQHALALQIADELPAAAQKA